MPGERKTILVVEDNKPFQKLLKSILLKGGYDVFVAGDGVEGLAQVRQRRPHMVLMDIKMPRMNGYDLCKAVRAEPGFERIPIIMISSNSETEDVTKGLGIGADDYLTKPFIPVEVLARITALFRQSGGEPA